MDYLRTLWENSLMRRIIIGIGIFLIIIFIIILIASCSKNARYSYEELESKMIKAAQNYYFNNQGSLPQKSGDEVELSLQTLISAGYLKPTNEMLESGESCTGSVMILNNRGEYSYFPILNCGENHKTESLYEILTDSNNIRTSGNGLYRVDNGYYFKGDNVNNYVRLNDTDFRIIGIDSDNNIELISKKGVNSIVWDDRYNISNDSNYGINDFVSNGINSRIKDSLEELYNSEDLDGIRAYLLPMELCIGKVSQDDTSLNEDKVCSKKISDQYIGLLNVYEYLRASLDENCNGMEDYSCTNYNYFADMNSSWTITADADVNFKAFKFDSSGISSYNASNSSSINYVVKISKNTIVSGGSGLEDDPYLTYEFKK